MSEERDRLYRFRSSSQVLIYTMLRGRRVRIKFSLLFDGVSRYSTSDALLASKIRDTEQFKQGRIIEDEPIMHTVVTEEPKKEEPKKAPSWSTMSMASRQPDANKIAAKKAEKKALEQGESTRDQKPVKKEEAQTELFGLKAEDVDSYMAAKEYLRSVGAESSQIKNKSLMQSYCQENGIEFPNYDFE